jgi:hypothetical protein
MPLVGVDYFGHILIWRARYNGSPKIYASVFFDYFREVRGYFGVKQFLNSVLILKYRENILVVLLFKMQY